MRSSTKTSDKAEGLNLRQVLARGTSAAFALQATGLGLSYGVQVLLARVMGTAEYGLYTYALSWTTLLAIVAGLGLRPAVLRFIPEYTTHEAWARLRGLLRRSSQLTLLSGLAVALLGTALLIGLGGRLAPMYRAPLMVSVWIVPLLALVNLQGQMARAARRMTLAFAPTSVLRPLLLAAGALAVLQATGSLGGTAMLGVAAGAFALVAGLQQGLLGRVWPDVLRRARPAYATRAWLRVALPLLFVSGFLVLLRQTDRLMIGALLGPEDVARYHVAARTSGLVLFPFTAVSAMAAPLFASLYAERKQAALQRLVLTVARWSFWPALALGVLLAGGSEVVLGLFGSEYRSVRLELVILVVAGLVDAGTGSASYLINLTGHQDRGAMVFGWSAVLNIVLNAVAIAYLGITGAALATGCTTVLWNVWLYRLTAKHLGIRASILDTFRTSTRGAPR